MTEIHSSRGGAGGEAPLTGSGVSPEHFSFLLLASVGGSYEWISVMKLDIYVQYRLEENLAQLTKIQISRLAFPVLQLAIRIYL